MPSRNGSGAYGRSLRADIAVLNPATGKMEFPHASKVLRRELETAEEKREVLDLAERFERQADMPMFKSDFQITDEVRKDLEEIFGSFRLLTEEYKSGKSPDKYGWHTGYDFKSATEEEIKRFLSEYRGNILDEAKGYRKTHENYQANSPSVYVLGKDKGSEERIKALEELRKKSDVQEVIFRGQDAYEVLDAKKAAEVIKQARKEDRAYGGTGYKKSIGYTGSEGDGLYHLTPQIGYASGYGRNGGVIQGVLASNKLLDLSGLTAADSIYYAKTNKAYTERLEKYLGKGNLPLSGGWTTRGSMPSYDEVKAFESTPHPQGGTMRDQYGKWSKDEVVSWKWAHALADTISKNYERVNGKPMPADLGVKKADKEKTWYKPIPLGEKIFRDLQGRMGVTYQFLKTPVFKTIMKQAGFDAVKYMDYGVGIYTPEGTPAYGATKPTQFKSYFGNKKVDLKSPNMFDAD
jgi:hypothetical protein